METIIVIGVGLTTIGFAMALLLAVIAKRPKQHAASTGDSSMVWIDGGGGSDCDTGTGDGGCDGGGGDGGGGGGGD